MWQSLRDFPTYSIPGSLIILALAIFFYALYRSKTVRTKHEALKTFLCFLAIIVAARGGIGAQVIYVTDAFSYRNTALGHLILNGVFTSTHMEFLDSRDEPDYFSNGEIAEILDLPQSTNDQHYPLDRYTQASSTASKHNIVFLLVESLTNRYVDYFGKDRYGLTPQP